MEGPNKTEAWLKLNALECSPKRTDALLDAFGRDPLALFAASPDEWRTRIPSLTGRAPRPALGDPGAQFRQGMRRACPPGRADRVRRRSLLPR